MADNVAPAQPTAPAAAPTGEAKTGSATTGATQAQVSHVQDNVSPKQAAEMLHSLKVNGETKQVPYEVLVALAQKAEAGEERFRQAAELQKRLKGGADKFKEDPTILFKELGMDADEWTMKRAETLLSEIMQDAELGPEAKKLREAERKLKDYEEKERIKGEEEQKAKFTEEKKKQVLAQGRIIYEAVEMTSLPHTDYTAKLMENVIRGCVESGTPYTPRAVAYWAEQQEQSHIQHQLQTLAKQDKAKLLKLLGPEVLKAINGAELETAKKAPGSGSGAQTTSSPKKDPDDKRKSEPYKNRSDDAVIRRLKEQFAKVGRPT